MHEKFSQIKSPFDMPQDDTNNWILQDKAVEIRQALEEKYDQQFNIFRKIPIYFMMYNFTKSVATLNYKDAVHISSDKQFLRRVYGNPELSKRQGLTESQQRLRLLTNCLNRKEIKQIITYEYPTMYITQTHNIFQMRIRRLKRQMAVEVSSSISISLKYQVKLFSDQSQSKSIQNKFLTESGLGESSSSLSQYIQQISSLKIKNFSSSIYDIYENANNEKLKIQKLNLNVQKQDDLQYLIYDLGQRQTTSENISVFPRNKFNSTKLKQRNRFSSPDQQTRLKKIHDKYEKIRISHEYFNRNLQKDQKNGTVKKSGDQNSRKSLARKGLIQEKAKQLLKRVQNQKQFQSLKTRVSAKN